MIRLQDEMLRATRRFEASGRPASEATAREIELASAMREARTEAARHARAALDPPQANRWLLARWLAPKRYPA